jgi:3-hydroxyacyl-CoA dehydrogenase, C-terminal domain
VKFYVFDLKELEANVGHFQRKSAWRIELSNLLRQRLENTGNFAANGREADVIIDIEGGIGLRDASLWFDPETEMYFQNADASAYIFCDSNSANHNQRYSSNTSLREKIIGFSIIPPFTDSSILEIARPLQTPVKELRKARSFFESLGFTVVEVPDGPGLIQARIVACLANEAFSALSEGVADAKTIDTAMKLGTNYPLGPLEWAELIGLESILAIMEGLQSEYGEDRYRPHPLLKRLVAANMSIGQFEAWKLEE